MGFASWMARKGAVGGTARWAAKMYRAVLERYPQLAKSGPAAVYRMMIAKRYELAPNEAQMEYLGDRAYEVEGLMGLVVEILKVEASMADNEPEVLSSFLSVVLEELQGAGLTREEIFGEHRMVGDYLQQAASKPTPL